MLTQEQFTECYHAHFRVLCFTVFSYTKSMVDAESIVQDSYVKLWERRECTEKETAKSFLFVTATNAAKNYWRHLKVLDENEVPLGDHFDRLLSDDSIVAYMEYVNLLYEAIEKLPPRRKEVMKAYIEHGRTEDARSISSKIKMNYLTWKEQKKKATQFLREYFRLKAAH